MKAAELSGIVFDIQRAALDDGPGLRTVVFLKGCPLRCAWCHNPESQHRQPERGRGGKIYGKEMSVSDVMHPVLADRRYYQTSGGGVTLSGGEPTMQFKFCKALLTRIREEGLDTCLDTCGHFPAGYLRELLPLVDLWHFDYKATGAAEHRRWTGVDGHRIRRNLETLLEAGARVRLRCPVVPGANDTPQHLRALEAFESSGRFEQVERLDYHCVGNPKYADLGRPAPRFSDCRMVGAKPLNG